MNLFSLICSQFWYITNYKLLIFSIIIMNELRTLNVLLHSGLQTKPTLRCSFMKSNVIQLLYKVAVKSFSVCQWYYSVVSFQMWCEFQDWNKSYLKDATYDPPCCCNTSYASSALNRQWDLFISYFQTTLRCHLWPWRWFQFGLKRLGFFF